MLVSDSGKPRDGIASPSWLIPLTASNCISVALVLCCPGDKQGTDAFLSLSLPWQLPSRNQCLLPAALEVQPLILMSSLPFLITEHPHHHNFICWKLLVLQILKWTVPVTVLISVGKRDCFLIIGNFEKNKKLKKKSIKRSKSHP